MIPQSYHPDSSFAQSSASWPRVRHRSITPIRVSGSVIRRFSLFSLMFSHTIFFHFITIRRCRDIISPMSSLAEITLALKKISKHAMWIDKRINTLHRMGITTTRGHQFNRSTYHYYANRQTATAGAANRAARLRTARLKGTHTPEEWSAILMRANGHCESCHRQTPRLTKDHIVPLYAGGSDAITNIRAICRRCNSSRGASTYADTPADKIKAVRDFRGETTREFASHFCRSHRTIEDWEQGRRVPSGLEMRQLAWLRAAKVKKNKRKRSTEPHMEPPIDITATP